MKLSAEYIGLLVQKAFVLEAIADKPGCTGRYKELPGKPLEDFVLAGLNTAPFFVDFARKWQDNPDEDEIFTYQLAALKASNQHKSEKFINMGLLELMFPFVAARIRCDDPDSVIDKACELLVKAPRSDVERLIAVRKFGWAKSKNRTAKMKELNTDVIKAQTPADFYERFADQKDLVPSAYQWGDHYANKYPFVREQFMYLQHSEGPLLDRIKKAFTPVAKANPDIKIGILADACAVAIFLHLSFSV